MVTDLGTLPQRHDNVTCRSHEIRHGTGVLTIWLMPGMRKRPITVWWPCWGVRGSVTGNV
jgi:hypothetical protein